MSAHHKPRHGTGRPLKYMSPGGIVCPGVTTIIKRYSDQEGLIAWANKIGLEGKTLAMARDKRADVGKLAHAMCAAYLAGQTWAPAPRDEAQDIDEASEHCARFVTWWEQSELTVAATELPLVSAEYLFGGTMDLVARDPSGGLIVADIKTGRTGGYPEWLAQLGGYAVLWREHHPDEPIGLAQVYHTATTPITIYTFDAVALEAATSWFVHATRLFQHDRDLAHHMQRLSYAKSKR